LKELENNDHTLLHSRIFKPPTHDLGMETSFSDSLDFSIFPIKQKVAFLCKYFSPGATVMVAFVECNGIVGLGFYSV